MICSVYNAPTNSPRNLETQPSIEDCISNPAPTQELMADGGAVTSDKENVAVVQFRGTMRGAQDAATQTHKGLSSSATQWSDWGMTTRATFRPATNEQGRPVFHPDAEEAEGQLRQLKKDLSRAHEERDVMRAKLVQKDKEIKKRDHRIFKQLEDHQHAKLLPKALSSLVKDCLTSGREEELERLREQVIRLEGAADAMRTDALMSGGTTPAAGTDTPVAAKLAGRFLDEEVPSSPMRRQKSLGSSGSMRNALGGGAGGGGVGGEALTAARAEIERLQKLNAAHEVIREGLEKRVAQLEAQLAKSGRTGSSALSPAKPAGAGAAALPTDSVGDDGSAGLYTEDGHGFDNYIRRLAGLSQLPAPAKHAVVKVGTSPSARKRAAGQTPPALAAGDADMMVYEITCHTGDVPGAGTSANCYITFRGRGGEYGPCALERADAHSAAPGAAVLGANATDVFDVVAVNVEPITSILLSHDMSGSAPCWHVRTLSVRRHRTDRTEPKVSLPLSLSLSLSLSLYLYIHISICV